MSHILHSPSAHSSGVDVSQMLLPQEGTAPQSLGSNTSNIPQYPSHGPSLPPHYGGDTAVPAAQNGFAPLQSDYPPQPPNNTPPATMVSSTPDYNHPAEDFHPYDPTQKPEARSNRGLPKHSTPVPSPEDKPSSTGRRRTRTKVVAWDPRDLEDIYVRKEINKEDWDSICRDYPTRTRVAMRQQVIKLREKKQREAMGLPVPGKSSTYSDSPQPAPNGIKWASVNGYQSSHADAEESSDDYELSSAPESEHDGKLNNHFDKPAR
ncbi:MAG: hypothetical protein Q9179_007574, partial [Wetmoreana sp. 5 TL-2023]